MVIEDLFADKHLSRLHYPNWFVKAPGHVLTLRETLNKQTSLGKINKRNLSYTQRNGFLNFLMKGVCVCTCTCVHLCVCVFSIKTPVVGVLLTKFYLLTLVRDPI